MGIFYCKCLTCNHTGNVNLPADTCTSKFVCSKCGSRNVISVYRDLSKETKHYSIMNQNNLYENTGYYDDTYEDKIFAEERQLDAMMMAPTGWEDDKEFRESMGI